MPVLNCFLLCFATYRWDNWIKNIPTVLSSGSPESPFPGVQRSLAAQQVTSHLPYYYLPLITERMKSPSLALFVLVQRGWDLGHPAVNTVHLYRPIQPQHGERWRESLTAWQQHCTNKRELVLTKLSWNTQTRRTNPSLGLVSRPPTPSIQEDSEALTRWGHTRASSSLTPRKENPQIQISFFLAVIQHVSMGA